MDTVSNILLAFFQGVRHSITGSVEIFLLDKKIKEKEKRLTPLKERNFGKKDAVQQELNKKVAVKKQEDPKILTRTLQCCALNGGVFGCSILIFNYGLLPIIKYFLIFLFGESSNTGQQIWTWMELFLSCTFSAFWVLPLFFLSKIVNSLWFQDIADSAYRYSSGRPQTVSGISRVVADTLFSILVEALFLLQTMFVKQFPITSIAFILDMAHSSMLYSLYAFEYKWCNMGWELHMRLTFIEKNWPYFIGFGFPLTLLTTLSPSYIISGCIFSVFFPFFIISGNQADPVVGVCDFPLQLFTPVIVISNTFFNIVRMGSNKKKEGKVINVLR